MFSSEYRHGGLSPSLEYNTLGTTARRLPLMQKAQAPGLGFSGICSPGARSVTGAISTPFVPVLQCQAITCLHNKKMDPCAALRLLHLQLYGFDMYFESSTGLTKGDFHAPSSIKQQEVSLASHAKCSIAKLISCQKWRMLVQTGQGSIKPAAGGRSTEARRLPTEQGEPNNVRSKPSKPPCFALYRECQLQNIPSMPSLPSFSRPLCLQPVTIWKTCRFAAPSLAFALLHVFNSSVWYLQVWASFGFDNTEKEIQLVTSGYWVSLFAAASAWPCSQVVLLYANTAGWQ